MNPAMLQGEGGGALSVYPPMEQRLSTVLREFASTMVTDFPIQAILDHLVQRIVDVLPITAAGVTLISPGQNPHYVAASDPSALRYEKLQTELGEGPCTAAHDTGEAVGVPDLHQDPRFPVFAERALELGLVAVFAIPLCHGEKRLGALDLYRDTPGALDELDMDAAETLADVAAAYLLNAQARSDLQASRDQCRSSAVHDALTGLPNRILLLERLEHAVARSQRSGRLAGVLFADLDGFKAVNDLHGHAAGDELLISVAERLALLLRPGDTLARLSGDEFVILCEDLDDPVEVDAIAQRLVDAVATPFTLTGAPVQVSISVGTALAAAEDGPGDLLLRTADAAMYQAKRKGGGRFQGIDVHEQEQTDRRTRLLRDLRGAMARGELRNAYQPIVRTTDGVTTEVEALLRWDHAAEGLVSPSILIPMAEQSGLILEIGQWVLEQSCTDLGIWNDGIGDPVGVSVNVSATQLMAPGYMQSVQTVLDATSTSPDLLTVEITESVFIQDSERALMVLADLTGLGVQIALDDFGTGYSALSYLRQYPIDTVKIDREFISDVVPHTGASNAIVTAVVQLAHVLHMTVIAEGVETAEQYERLASLGCDHSQGYHHARPMGISQLCEHLQARGGSGGDR